MGEVAVFGRTPRKLFEEEEEEEKEEKEEEEEEEEKEKEEEKEEKEKEEKEKTRYVVRKQVWLKSRLVTTMPFYLHTLLPFYPSTTSS